MLWLKRRRPSDGTPQDPAAPPAVNRAPSVGSVDLEGAYTPRFRQPTPSLPLRPALKQSASFGGGAGGVVSLQAQAQAPRGPMLLPGVHLLPRVPSGSSSLKPNVQRTMAAVEDLRGERVQRVQHDAYVAQQAAEQAAMREYLRGKPQASCWWAALCPLLACCVAPLPSSCLCPLVSQPARLPAPSPTGARHSQAHTPAPARPCAGGVGGRGGACREAGAHTRRPPPPRHPPRRRLRRHRQPRALQRRQPRALRDGAQRDFWRHAVPRCARLRAQQQQLARQPGRRAARARCRARRAVAAGADSARGSAGAGGQPPQQRRPRRQAPPLCDQGVHAAGGCCQGVARGRVESPCRCTLRASTAALPAAAILQEHEASLAAQQAASRLDRTSSAPSEGPAPAAPHDRSQLTGAWVASGGRIQPSQVLDPAEAGRFE